MYDGRTRLQQLLLCRLKLLQRTHSWDFLSICCKRYWVSASASPMSSASSVCSCSLLAIALKGDTMATGKTRPAEDDGPTACSGAFTAW